MLFEEWNGFELGKWSNDEIDVRDFIQKIIIHMKEMVVS